MSGFQDLGNPAVEALDHAVGLGACGLDEPMVDALVLTQLIEWMPTPWLGGSRDEQISFEKDNIGAF